MLRRCGRTGSISPPFTQSIYRLSVECSTLLFVLAYPCEGQHQRQDSTPFRQVIETSAASLPGSFRIGNVYLDPTGRFIIADHNRSSFWSAELESVNLAQGTHRDTIGAIARFGIVCQVGNSLREIGIPTCQAVGAPSEVLTAGRTWVDTVGMPRFYHMVESQGLTVFSSQSPPLGFVVRSRDGTVVTFDDYLPGRDAPNEIPSDDPVRGLSAIPLDNGFLVGVIHLTTGIREFVLLSNSGRLIGTFSIPIPWTPVAFDIESCTLLVIRRTDRVEAVLYSLFPCSSKLRDRR